MSRSARTHAALLLLSASLAASLGACSHKSDGARGTQSAARAREIEFEPNDVLDDASLTDTRMTAADVQAFLDRTPYGGKRSALATYEPTTTKTAAQIIAGAAAKYEINPMLLLVRAQLENELVSKTTATPTELARAFGCGCSATTSAAVCTPAPAFRGFENQALCAASQLRTALDHLSGKEKDGGSANRTTDGTTKGWAAHKRQTTRDGIEVTPENDATAVLYAYKPWVGELGNGDPGEGGMSAHWRLWNDFTATTTECSAGDMTRCRAELEGDACIAGRCGCLTSADCGSGGGRICDRLHGVCMDAPSPSTPDASPPTPSPTTPDAATGQTTPTPPQDPSSIPADTSSTSATSTPTPELPSSSSSSADSGRKDDEKIDVPSTENGGCTTAPRHLQAASDGALGTTALGLALAVALVRRRRRLRPAPTWATMSP